MTSLRGSPSARHVKVYRLATHALEPPQRCALLCWLAVPAVLSEPSRLAIWAFHIWALVAAHARQRSESLMWANRPGARPSPTCGTLGTEGVVRLAGDERPHGLVVRPLPHDRPCLSAPEEPLGWFSAASAPLSPALRQWQAALWLPTAVQGSSSCFAAISSAAAAVEAGGGPSCRGGAPLPALHQEQAAPAAMMLQQAPDFL